MRDNWKQNTAIFLGSQLISLFGSALVQFAITWHITLTTQSGVYMTLAIICGFLPTFILSPFAGVWADRYNRKWLVMISDGCIALTTLILALTILAGYNAIWPLFAALGIRALGSAVQLPCINAILPTIVPQEHLTRVNGINGSAQSVITLVSPMLSAVLLKSAPFFAIFFVDVISATIAISILLLFFRLPRQQTGQAGRTDDYFSEMRAGISYVMRTDYLRVLFLFLAAFFFLFAPAAFLTPLQVTRNFGENEWHLMAVEVAFSVGMVLGGIFIAWWGGFRNRIHSMGLAAMLMGLCTALLWLPIPLNLYLVLMGVFGVSIPIYSTPAMVMLQERIDPDFRGRVFGVMTMISSSLMPMGMLVFGPLADVLAIEWILLGTGVAMMLLTVRFIRNKALLRAGMRGGGLP